MVDKHIFIRFYHQGEFQKTKYSCGTCTKIPEPADADRLSLSEIMEHVKNDVGYTEIGGVYVKKGGCGWKIVNTDADMTGLVDRLTDGSSLDLYIDTVVDKAIEPANQIQPHVIIRPRTQYFEGPNFQLKRKFVTIQDLKQQQLDKKKSATGDGDKQIMRTTIIKKPSGSELKKINTNDEEILVPTEKEKVVFFLFDFAKCYYISSFMLYYYHVILRVPANEGIGSMEAYLLLQQQKRDKEEREKRGHDIMNYEGDRDSNHGPPVSSVHYKNN
ncbi:hypothetical protein POM88_053255 [Heracleum sosnowskyi]|uniref:PB1-like domain-containing protein n=1 Tax=Heracleum sosnowskyi TaxID=360622 RepID=A0AAD8GR28_9APIA|nr:hypothetical protein POM88_053255 [Heracleum sosnowskyi]